MILLFYLIAMNSPYFVLSTWFAQYFADPVVIIGIILILWILLNHFSKKNKRWTESRNWFWSMKLISWAIAKWEMKDWMKIWEWELEYKNWQIKRWLMKNWSPNGTWTISGRDWTYAKWNVKNWKLTWIWVTHFSDWEIEKMNADQAWLVRIDNTL